MYANRCAARAALCVLLVPVTHIFPDANMSAVALGSLNRMITAAKRLGLNSVLRHRRAICLRSNLTPRLAVLLMFWMRTRIVPPSPSDASITDPARDGVVFCVQFSCFLERWRRGAHVVLVRLGCTSGHDR
eukprot:scaffold588_cov282-Chaetoceros_neogracile.AAC.4